MQDSSGNRFAESGAYVSLGQPVHSSYRQLVCEFLSPLRQCGISTCFDSADLFCVTLSNSIPASTKTSRLSIPRFRTNKLDIFPDGGFCLSHTCANFNHKNPIFALFLLFIHVKTPSLSLFYRGLSLVEFFGEGNALSRAIGLAQIGRRINKAHTQRRESDRHSQRYDLWRNRK